MTHKGTKTIKTSRLTLRKFCKEDIPAVYKNWASDPEVTKFLTWPTHGSVEITKKVVNSWVEQNVKPDFYQWAIVPEEVGEPIGTISVVDIQEAVNGVEIGYCIGKEWWGQGIVSEAFSAIIPFLFEEAGVNRIMAGHDKNNPNSGAVMKKCGLTYEGTLRQSGRNNQGIVDMCIYSILREEYRSLRER